MRLQFKHRTFKTSPAIRTEFLSSQINVETSDVDALAKLRPSVLPCWGVEQTLQQTPILRILQTSCSAEDLLLLKPRHGCRDKQLEVFLQENWQQQQWGAGVGESHGGEVSFLNYVPVFRSLTRTLRKD